SPPSPANFPCSRRHSAVIMRCSAASAPRGFLCRSRISCETIRSRTKRPYASIWRGICAAAPAMSRSSTRRSMPRPNYAKRTMLDLGTSFRASVERDPRALAIVDGAVRLTYAEWYRRISSLVAAFDQIGLKLGDHLLTVLQNRWEAATLHWACQFAGLVMTPINWRAKADDVDFCAQDSQAKAVVYEGVSADAVAGSREAQKRTRIALDAPRGSDIAFQALVRGTAPDPRPRVGAEAWSVMLYTSGTTAKPKGVPRRHRGERAAALAHVAQNLYAHGEITLGVMPLYHTMGVRSLLAMSLIGGAFICLPRFDAHRALAL